MATQRVVIVPETREVLAQDPVLGAQTPHLGLQPLGLGADARTRGEGCGRFSSRPRHEDSMPRLACVRIRAGHQPVAENY